MRIVPALAPFVAAFAAALAAADPPASAPLLSWHLVKEYPHDSQAFTEGLVLDAKGRLIESSGNYGLSTLSIRTLATGKVVKSVPLAPRFFGEGATIVGDHIVQFPFTGEGWGLSYDGEHLIQSDGSAALYFLDPRTYVTESHIDVRDGGNDIYNLNELEYARGRIYANVWHTDRIAVIVPQTGQVEAWIDLASLKSHFAVPLDGDQQQDDVLNGIAFDARSGHLYVTGKHWPKLFEIALDPAPQSAQP
jgi:glutamine cyclotransferase